MFTIYIVIGIVAPKGATKRESPRDEGHREEREERMREVWGPAAGREKLKSRATNWI